MADGSKISDPTDLHNPKESEASLDLKQCC